MAIISIEFTGFRKLDRMLGRLSVDLRTRAGKRILHTAATTLQKSMKLRAPVWSGALKESIQVSQINSNTFRVSSSEGYASAQEFGYRKHPVWGFFPTKSGYLFSDWLLSKGTTNGYWKLYWPTKFKPFARPSYEKLVQNLDDISKRIVDDTIRGTGFHA